MSTATPAQPAAPAHAASTGAVTVLVTRRIKPGMEAMFEKLMGDMITVARTYPGHLGAQLVRPGEQDDAEPGLYQVVFAFDTDAHLQAWKDSPARSLGLAAIEPLVEGPARMQQVIGLAHWFMTGTQQTPPPRWKVAIVTWMGIFPTVLLLFILLGDILSTLPLVLRVGTLTGLVVLIMTWVVAPQLTRLMKPWLHKH